MQIPLEDTEGRERGEFGWEYEGFWQDALYPSHSRAPEPHFFSESSQLLGILHFICHKVCRLRRGLRASFIICSFAAVVFSSCMAHWGRNIHNSVDVRIEDLHPILSIISYTSTYDIYVDRNHVLRCSKSEALPAPVYLYVSYQ